MTPTEIAKLFLKQSKKIKQEHIDILANNISTLNANWTFNQKVWHFYHNTDIEPTCNHCKQPCKFNSKSYSSWCSNKCMSTDPEVLNKKQATNLKRHGNEFPQSLDKFKDKQKQTNIDKYGVDNFAKSAEFLIKSKATFMEKYGVDNPSKDPGVVEIIRNKALSRNYDDVMSKRRKTNIEKFGCVSNKHIHMSAENVANLNDIDFLIDQHITQKKSCNQIARELGCSSTPILTKLTKAGVTVRRYTHSSGEIELANFIKTIYNKQVVSSDRTIICPLELDIFLPDVNIAIEFNGVYWHSELFGKHKQYHLNKTLGCITQNIELLHIYDTEWNDLTKQNIIKSKIAGKLQLHNRIFARNTQIQIINSKTKTAFLNENHIQGNCASSINIGLFHNDQMVAVMTFGKSRFSKKYDYELLRFCTIQNITVVGGASKLFKHFTKNYNGSIVSYADRRFSSGNLYEKLGFEFIHDSPPNYKYFHDINPGQLLNRIKFQKHKLEKILDVFDPNLTEWENMQANGYNRIWDCGNKVYKWSNK